MQWAICLTLANVKEWEFFSLGLGKKLANLRYAMSVWAQTESKACPETVFRGQESKICKSSSCPLPVLLVDFITADVPLFFPFLLRLGWLMKEGE